MSEKRIYRSGYSVEGKRVVATDFSKDRDGERIDPAGVDLRSFKKNPIMLFGHNHQQLPIGTAESIRKSAHDITFEPLFSNATQLAREVAALWKEGVLKAVSIGFIPKEVEDNIFTKTELIEISVVNVPSNPNALAEAKAKGLNVELLNKQATGNPNLDKFPDTRAWDASAAIKRIRSWAGGPAKEDIDFNKYKQAFAWHDTTQPEKITSYKLPFSDVEDDELKAVWRGVAAAEGALLGARGGVDLPDATRRTVHNFLGVYYKKFEREQPEFRSFETIEQVLEMRKSLLAQDAIEFIAALHSPQSEKKQAVISDEVEIAVKDEQVLQAALEGFLQVVNSKSNVLLSLIKKHGKKEKGK
ncbi:hypothetical protein LCGC14_0418100 [marine sediment metagenome]|uniref:Prohead serine protease domain-containing protein n=1 Tax=marine sediment metagenome TaxID=412755 RepID=A0A0F9SXS7_9ZZZZ